MTEIGKPLREIEVQPLEDPVPREQPTQPERPPAEPVKEPEKVSA